MISPIVTELPRRLEPVSRDTFHDQLAGADTPSGTTRIASRGDEISRTARPARRQRRGGRPRAAA